MKGVDIPIEPRRTSESKVLRLATTLLLPLISDILTLIELAFDLGPDIALKVLGETKTDRLLSKIVDVRSPCRSLQETVSRSTAGTLLGLGVTLAGMCAWWRYYRFSSCRMEPSKASQSTRFFTDPEDLELEDTEFDSEHRIAKDSSILRRVSPDVVSGALAKIYFRTFGCSHNVSDSEFMMGLLVKYGYVLVESIEECDLCILNSCTVKNPSQDAASNLAEKVERLGKHIVVTGCVPQADQSIPIFERASLVGVSNIMDIVTVVEETLKGNRVVAIGKSSDLPDIASMPKIRRNKLIEIIAVSTGCLGQCTYCKTKHARGELGSYPVSTIIQRVQTAVVFEFLHVPVQSGSDKVLRDMRREYTREDFAFMVSELVQAVP
ncbi:Methylthiotransferase, partial [Perkinsus sp. BL_2016]